MKTIYWTALLILFTYNWAGTQHVPKMKLKDLNNKRQELSQYYSDGPILMNFWNLACEPCKKEMKELDKSILFIAIFLDISISGRPRIG